MLRVLIPVIFALTGVAAGVGAGLAFKSSAPGQDDQSHDEAHDMDDATDHETHEATEATHETSDHQASGDTEFVKLNNQFIVPILKDSRVAAMVILSLSLESPSGSGAAIYAKEPKVRDTFLRVLFEFANAGGFDGKFTSARNLDLLSQMLLQAGQDVLGDQIIDVLVGDIARQDV